MSRYRFTIEYRTRDGEPRRTVFFADMNGLRWFRREERFEDGTWVRESHTHVMAPTIEATSIGIGATFAGP
jgi:hypothetical protein